MKRFTAAVLGPVIALLLGAPAYADGSTPGAGRVDINTATKDELKATLGVGDEDAAKIVEARPYAKKDDLKDRNVVTADQFEKIKKLIESVC